MLPVPGDKPEKRWSRKSDPLFGFKTSKLSTRRLPVGLLRILGSFLGIVGLALQVFRNFARSHQHVIRKPGELGKPET